MFGHLKIRRMCENKSPNKFSLLNRRSQFCMFRTIFTIGYTTFFYEYCKLSLLSWHFYQLNYGEVLEKRFVTQQLFISAKIKGKGKWNHFVPDLKKETSLLRPTNWAVVAQLLSACLKILQRDALQNYYHLSYKLFNPKTKQSFQIYS